LRIVPVARVGQGHADLHVVADRERVSDPLVLHEPTRGGVDYQVHAEAPGVEAALGFELAQLVQARRRENADRVEIEERAGGDSGREPTRVEERRTELRFDDLVAVSVRIVVLLVRVVLIDRVAVLRGARQLGGRPCACGRAGSTRRPGGR
jgi:hypothetical protein